MARTSRSSPIEQVSELVLKTPKIYLGMVKHFFSGTNWTKWLGALNDDKPVWFDVGYHVSGGKAYGHKYEWRCQALFDALSSTPPTTSSDSEGEATGSALRSRPSSSSAPPGARTVFPGTPPEARRPRMLYAVGASWSLGAACIGG